MEVFSEKRALIELHNKKESRRGGLMKAEKIMEGVHERTGWEAVKEVM